MPTSEVWFRLDLRNPLHQRVLQILGNEDEENGGAAELLQGSPHSPSPLSAAPSVPQVGDQPPAPVTLSNLERKHQRLRSKVLSTKVGRNFLLPVISAMEPGRWYTLEEMAVLKAGYSKRQAHSSLGVAGKIEKRFGEIFERQQSEEGGPLKLRVTSEMKTLLSRVA